MAPSKPNPRSRAPLALALLALALLRAVVPATARVPAAAAPDFAAIDAYVEAQMRALRIPGLALGIVQGEQVVHLKGFGRADHDGQPVTPQTPFQINSLGKPMTGVAIMQLAEAGKLDLDAPVQRYLPWFRVADEAASAQITIRHLLYHTSGLPTMAGITRALSGDDRPDALESQVRELRSVQLSRPVGQAYAYSNAGYMVLGLLVQQISGQPYEAYMHEHIFAPLDMRQTFTDWSQARAHGAASGHRYWLGVPIASDMPVNRASLPAGAHMSACVEDVGHFLIAELNGGRFGKVALLSPSRIAEMQRPVIAQGDGRPSYAMGWNVGLIGDALAISKGGASADFMSLMILLPERQLGLVVLMNSSKGFDPSQRLLGLPHNVAEMLLGQQPTVFPSDPRLPLLYAILFLAVIVQAAGMARTVMLRRWRDQPDIRPRGAAALVTRLGLPLLCNLGWSLFALMGLSRLLGTPLSLIIYFAPDFGYILVLSGVVALVWSLLRTVVVLGLLRPRGPDRRATIVLPA